ncbi:MAG: M1 family metallopeptidase [Flavobacteriaceae bacterium]|nr:M1 family metallopeptidase [Flavobacteriaceae bacterium]
MRRVLPFFIFCFQWAFPQFQNPVDATRLHAQIRVVAEEKAIEGRVTYDFDVTAPVDSIVFDAIAMEIEGVSNGTQPLEFKNTGKQVILANPFASDGHSITISYRAVPKKTVYFIGFDDAIEGNEQIWTQGQGKYTSNWLPSFDNMNEKVEHDLTIITASNHTVVANGKLVETQRLRDSGEVSWKFDMKAPMSNYLAAFVIGGLSKKTVHSASGIPIELYYHPDDSAKFEPTYRYTQRIFDFLEAEIGVAYPWQNYKQVPVRDFLYAGMENTGCTIFSNQYVIDSTAFVDKNYVNVNAHELAHQWFGNLVTEQSGKHHWLHEGFATYYAYLTERMLFGDDHFYWRLYETANTLHNVSENGGGEALTDPNANSLTFYEKGAWALVMLRDRLGDADFKKGIRRFLTSKAYGNATIADFLEVMESVSGSSLQSFEEQWLRDDTFPWQPVKELLIRNNPSLAVYLKNKGQETDKKDVAQIGLDAYFFEESTPDLYRKQVVLDHVDRFDEASLKRVLLESSVIVRQAVVMGTLKRLPQGPQKLYEGLLDDASYLTQETALYKLWEAYPERRTIYLDRLDKVNGLPNYNVRLLWLTLALVTPGYRPENKSRFYKELNGYTAEEYNFETRLTAFKYLYQLEAIDDGSLVNLVKASGHHVWQFKKMARMLLREFRDSDQGRERLGNLAMDPPEAKLLQQILDK